MLSTKVLSQGQKNLLLNAGLNLVEYNAISHKFPPLALDSKWFSHVIITSPNAAKVVIHQKIQAQQCFCVGEKTTEALRQNGYQVVETADYAADLARVIAKNYPSQRFTFFSGNLRQDTLPAFFSKHRIFLQEIQVYHTSLNPRAFNQEFDGILFFSPSGVKSFTKMNRIGSARVFCIGKSTESEVKNHTKNTQIAKKPSIENVIVQAVNFFKK